MRDKMRTAQLLHQTKTDAKQQAKDQCWPRK
jgi:hypothetical protein